MSDDKYFGEPLAYLFAACFGGHVNLVRELIETKVDVNSTGLYGGKLLLNYAINSPFYSKEIIDMLLAAGARVDISDGSGRQPLLFACVKNDFELVSRFIGLGADVNHVSNFKSAALHLAAVVSSFEIIKLLVDSKANLELVDDKGLKALDLAKMAGRDNEILQLLGGKND